MRENFCITCDKPYKKWSL